MVKYIPKEWKDSRVVLVHKGGSKKEVRNYRPIAIIHVICKLFMMLIRDSINGWVEESGMLGDVQFFLEEDVGQMIIYLCYRE